MRKYLRNRRRYVIFLKKGGNWDHLKSIVCELFGITYLEFARLKLIKEDESFIVVSCRRGYERKLILISVFDKRYKSLKICGTIKKAMRVIKDGISNDGV